MRVLEGALNRLVAHASLFGRRVDTEVAESILSDLLRAYDRKITVEEIQRKVAEDFGIKAVRPVVATPRAGRCPSSPDRHVSGQGADRQVITGNRTQIRRRDHTTIMHGVKRVVQLSKDDPAFGDEVRRLLRALKH